MENKLRWGILGPGKIARSFADDLQLVKGSVLTAVASRSAEKAEAFRKEYGADIAYGSYEELYRSDKVDVIYIATPHTYHASQAISAMEHGKHVLCEKPMGVNATEVRQMIASAEKNGVFLMEALWSRFNPSIRKVKELADQGALGQIRYLQADFAFYALDRDPRGRLLNPELAGGSLLDIGIYPVFLAYLMMGKPSRILSVTKKFDQQVEVQTAIIFEYENGMAQLFSGLASHSEMRATISGTKASAYLHDAWHKAQGYTLEKERERQSHKLPTLGKGYSHEIIEVEECLKNGRLQSPNWSLENSLDLICLLDELRKQHQLSFPFEE